MEVEEGNESLQIWENFLNFLGFKCCEYGILPFVLSVALHKGPFTWDAGWYDWDQTTISDKSETK